MESMTASLSSHEGPRQDSLISFARLSPDLENPGQYSLQAVVTLVWPYSSSNGAFSLLLAEPDFRLRKQNGQVRVTFRGFCAEQVARTKVGIGDKVTLSLQGARWTENQKLHSTPGKTLEWELQFTNRVKLEAVRNDEVLAVVDVDSPPPPEIHAVPTTPSTSLPNIYGWPSDLAVTEKWDTPAFLRAKRLSPGSPLQSGFIPFGEEDGYIPGKGRKRPRFSFPSSGWRLVDEPDTDEPINEDNWFESDEEELQRNGEDVSVSEEPIQEDLQHPDSPSRLSSVDVYQTVPSGPLETTTEHQSFDVTPSPIPAMTTDKIDKKSISIQIQAPEEETSRSESLSKHHPLPTDTPRLHPLPSPGLAIPSPITSTSANPLGYFFQAAPPPQSSEYLAPTTAIDQNLDNIPTSSYALDVSEATHYDNGIPEIGESSLQPPSHVETGTSSFNSTTQFEPQDTVSQAPSVDISSFSARSNNHQATEIEGSLLIDPSISQLHEDHSYEQHGTVVHDMQMEGGHTESFESRYENVVEENTELSVEYTDNILPPQDQLDWNGKDVGGAVHAFEEKFSEDIDSEKMEQEHEPVANDAYNDSPEKYQTVSDDASSDGMEDEEVDDEGDYEAKEYEAEEYDDEMSEGLEDDVESDSEPDDEIGHNPPQQRSPPRNVYPEVIVLDSDSEDEPPPQVRQQSPQYDHISDDDENVLSADADEYAEYQSAKELDDETEDQMDAISEASSDRDLDEQLEDEDSDDESEKSMDSEHESTVDDESVRAEDEQLGLGVQDEDLVQQTDTGLFRSTSKEPYEVFKHSEQPSIYSMAETAHKISSVPEHEHTPSHEYGKDNVSSSGSPSSVQAPRPSSPNTVKLTHDTRPLVSRTRSLPTPQPTQGEEQHPASICSSTDVPSEKEGSTAGKGLDEEGRDKDKASLHQWTDGSGDEGHSPQPDTAVQVPEIEVNGHALEDDAESDDYDDNHDEVVLVESHSTPKSVESELYAEAIESPLRHEPSIPGPQKDNTPRRKLVELDDWLDTVVDIIAIVVEVSPMARASSGSKEYYLSLRITDATMAGTTVSVHIFNPDRASIPVVNEEDVIVLRKFKIQSFDHSTAALSGDSSAWAVFHTGHNQPTIAGPPVELGEDEYGYVQEVRDWYHRDGSAMTADHMLQASISQEQKEYSPSSAASSDVGSLGSTPAGSSQRRPRRRKSHRRITIHELRDGRRYTEVGSSGGNESIHELRDGTVYAHSFERD